MQCISGVFLWSPLGIILRLRHDSGTSEPNWNSAGISAEIKRQMKESNHCQQIKMLSHHNWATFGSYETKRIMITRLHFPEQLTQIERFSFLTARVKFLPQSLGWNNSTAESPHVLITASTATTSQTAAALTVLLKSARMCLSWMSLDQIKH